MDGQKVREIIERGGGFFIEVRGDEVRFRDASEINGETLSLYASACRSAEDVRLAIKASREREQLRNLNVWEKVQAVPPSGGALYERDV